MESMETPLPNQERPQHGADRRYYERAADLVRRTADTLSTRSLANVFVGIFALISAVTMILTPPFQSPDSTVHFDRIAGISYGEVLGSTSGKFAGGYLPAGVAQAIDAFSTLPFHSTAKTHTSFYSHADTASWNGRRTFQPFPATTARSPVLYVPGALAIVFTRLFSDRILVSYYMVELTNLLLFLWMAWWSIRQFHYTLAVPICIFLLLPMVVFLASSVNPDGLLLGLSVVYGAAVFQLFQHSGRRVHSTSEAAGLPRLIRRYFPNGFSKYDVIAWGSLALISLDKPPYAVLGLLLGISYLMQKDIRSYLSTVILGIGSIAFLEIVWLAFGSRTGTVPIATGSSNVSPSRQGQFLIHHLDSLLPLFVNTFRFNGAMYMRSGIGILGWLDTPLPTWSYYGASLLIVGSVIGLIVTTRPQPLPLLVAGIATIGAVVLIVLTLYADWTPVGATIALGVQGRYFLPLFPVLVACIGLSPRDYRSPRVPGLVGVLVMGMGCEVIMTIALLTRYWAAG